MKFVAFITVLLLCSNLCLSQINSNPSPTIGWDSLKSLLKYPELARRAGLEGNAIVTIDLRSTGEIFGIDISSNAEIFKEFLKHVLQNVKWNPAVKNGQAVQSIVRIPIYFLLGEVVNEGRCIIIEGKRELHR